MSKRMDALPELIHRAQRGDLTAFGELVRRFVFKQCDRLTRGKHAQMVKLTDALGLATATRYLWAKG
jgi:hypothetical protein